MARLTARLSLPTSLEMIFVKEVFRRMTVAHASEGG